MTTFDPDGDQILVLAPIGRDGPAAANLLRRVGLRAVICASLSELLQIIRAGAAAAFIAEEALFGNDLSDLTTWIERQPTWSDLPFIVLTSHQERPGVAEWRRRLVVSMRNVWLLERPVQAITLTSTVQAAFRARRRQYEVRDLLQAQEQAARELEALVIDRTRELEAKNEQLRQEMTERARIEEIMRQSQKMDAVGQLSGGIAHDFNNLLQAVAGSLDLIRRRPDERDRVRRWAEAALEAAERGARLTAQLLAFSRAQRIEARPIIVADLLTGLMDLLIRTLGPMIQIRLDLDSDRVAVLSDQTQLEMAILNLAINARDAMPDGGELAVTTRARRLADDPELAPGEYVELSVSDTGVGMSPDVAMRAFDPFYTTKEVGKGTGLGLSQVYGIARQAGGAARIESRSGRGTTVRMLMRRTDIPIEAGTVLNRDASERNKTEATVLVVDDDAHVRQFLADSLDSMGYRVVEAEDGRAGLRALEVAEPDVMVVDFAMPGLNGAEVANAARTKRPGLPIIFATGYADNAAIQNMAGPHTPVLRKPFRMDELQVAVAEALLNARPQR